MKELYVFYIFILLSGLPRLDHTSIKPIELPPCDDVELELSVTPPLTNLSCDFDCVTLSATGASSNGAYSISWLDLPGQSVVNVCEPGTYTAVITDILTGCSITATATIGLIDNTPVIDAGDNQTVSCVNTSTTLQSYIGPVNGDINISWSGPEDFESNDVIPIVEEPGTYYLSVHEVLGGCTVVDSVIVTEVYEYILTEQEAQFCPNECYYYNGVGYCEVGTIQVGFQSTQGCDSIVQLTLNEIPLSVDIAETDIITCNQTELTLDATQSTLYDEALLTWTTDNGHFTSNTNIPTPIVDQGGTYYLSIEWAGCTVYDTVTVQINQEDPDANAGDDVELDCIDLLATLNAAATLDTINKSFFWTGPEQFEATDFQVTVSNPGLYELTVEDLSNGCKKSDDVMVMEYIEFVPTLEVEPSCFNDSSGMINIVNHDLESSYKYALNDFETQENTDIEGLPPGHYQLIWRDDYGCGDTMLVTVPELSAIDLEMDETYQICGDNYVTLNAAVNINTTPGPVSYQWSNGSNAPALRTNISGYFWVEVTSACEVVHHDIAVENDLAPIAENVYVPNAFSPNNDDKNDFFRAYVNHDIVAYQLQVFDRRGSLMFSTDDPLEGWDGTLKGKKAPNAIYGWCIKVKVTTCGGGRDEDVLSGDVSLFR